MTGEMRRTLTHFLNGLSVATIAAGAIGPAVLGSFWWPMAAVTVIIGAVLHGAALWVSSSPYRDESRCEAAEKIPKTVRDPKRR